VELEWDSVLERRRDKEKLRISMLIESGSGKGEMVPVSPWWSTMSPEVTTSSTISASPLSVYERFPVERNLRLLLSGLAVVVRVLSSMLTFFSCSDEVEVLLRLRPFSGLEAFDGLRIGVCFPERLEDRLVGGVYFLTVEFSSSLTSKQVSNLEEWMD